MSFPEAGGSSSFARHAFNELVSFAAAWAQMLNYIITIAISAFFVPHYLSIFWEPLKQNPWDIVGGAVVIVDPRRAQHRRDPGVRPDQHRPRRGGLRHAGPARAARLRPRLQPAHTLVSNVHFGVAPTWGHFLLAIPVAMIAYTGIETVSNLSEEARDPLRTIPRSIFMVAVAVFAIYFTLPLIALSAMPVHLVNGHYETVLGLPPPQGFANDPVLGVVSNLGLTGALLSAIKIYVGILAATILFIATNAGVIGASRITYAMAGYRQLPSVFRRLHPKFKTPWLSLIIFGGFISILVLLPGQDELPRNDVLVRRDALLHDRARGGDPAAAAARRRGHPVEGPAQLPVARRRLAALRRDRRPRDGAVVARRRDRVSERALCGARLARARVRRLCRLPAAGVAHPPERDGARPGRVRPGGGARVPQHPRADRSRLRLRRGDGLRLPARGRAARVDRRVHGDRGAARPPARRGAAGGRAGGERAARRGARDRRLVRRDASPRRIARTRNIGRAIVDEAIRRHSEIIVMAGPRRMRLQCGRRQIFGDAVDFVLRHAPCRVMVATPRERAA